jgi:hypothetical protein
MSSSTRIYMDMKKWNAVSHHRSKEEGATTTNPFDAISTKAGPQNEMPWPPLSSFVKSWKRKNKIGIQSKGKEKKLRWKSRRKIIDSQSS